MVAPGSWLTCEFPISLFPLLVRVYQFDKHAATGFGVLTKKRSAPSRMRPASRRFPTSWEGGRLMTAAELLCMCPVSRRLATSGMCGRGSGVRLVALGPVFWVWAFGLFLGFGLGSGFELDLELGHWVGGRS
eukprot:scaffold24880_cov48-Phaeocystis_antarctica.AAC.2